MLTNDEVAAREHAFAQWTDLAARYLARGETADAFECLTRAVLVDGGDAPYSRYGTYAHNFAPVAALATLCACEDLAELRGWHETMIGYVVNDGDSPAYMGATIEDYLDADVIADARADIAAQNGE